MKLQFQQQKFQADTAKVMVDFLQNYLLLTYMMDNVILKGQMTIAEYSGDAITGWSNQIETLL